MGVAEIKMNEYKLALDITAKYQAKNDRYVRINGEKPENFGRVK